MISLDYDSEYDILNVALRDGSNSVGCEEYDGLVVMRDYTSREITGLMLYGFVDKYKSHRIPCLPKDITISIEKDVMPVFPARNML